MFDLLTSSLPSLQQSPSLPADHRDPQGPRDDDRTGLVHISTLSFTYLKYITLTIDIINTLKV